MEVICAGGGEEYKTEAEAEADTSKSQLFIFILSTCTQLVTYLTIKFDSQLFSSRTKHYQPQPALETAAFHQDLTF